MIKPTELDRHTILAVQRAVKRKARKVRHPAILGGERVVYCIRCLKSNHEVERILYDPFFSLCSECVENLYKFLTHLRSRENSSESGGQEGEI